MKVTGPKRPVPAFDRARENASTSGKGLILAFS